MSAAARPHRIFANEWVPEGRKVSGPRGKGLETLTKRVRAKDLARHYEAKHGFAPTRTTDADGTWFPISIISDMMVAKVTD